MKTILIRKQSCCIELSYHKNFVHIKLDGKHLCYVEAELVFDLLQANMLTRSTKPSIRRRACILNPPTF